MENKKDNLTTKSITRSQAKNNPKLAEIIEDNMKKAFEIKKKTAENQESENSTTPSNTSTSTSQKLEFSENPNQDTRIIISSSIPPNDRSSLTYSILFDNQVVSLRDALEVVPIFTGDNISLDQFIEYPHGS